MRIQYSYFCTSITGSCSATTARCHLSLSSMKLSRSLLRPSFFRRRNAAFRRSPFFSRKRGAAAADNPEPSSPKVTCIGQVRVQSQKKVKQCRRRIGEASFRSTDQQPPPPRWVHLPNITLLLRAFGHELCCWFRCRCCCGATREREREREKEREREREREREKERERERKREREIKYADENGCGALLGRWLVAEGGRRREIEVVVGGGGGDEEIMSAGSSRRHVFDDIEVKGDRIELKGRSGEGETTTFSICIPPKNALLLMRCRSDPLKMAAIANRISSDAAKYGYGGIEEKQEEEESYDESTSSEEFLEGEHKVYVAQVLEKREMRNVEDCGEKLVIINEKKVEEIEQELNEEEEEEEEKEETESNMSSFEALLDQENTEQDQDFAEVEEAKSDVGKASAHIEPNEDATIVQEEQNAVQPDKLEPEMPEHQETATKKETATTEAALPECLLLMMREPKLSMEVSKETWVCATDFIRLLPERPRRAAAKAAAAGGGGGDHHEPVVKRRSAVEKSRPRVPAPPGKRNDVQPARSSCSLPAASTAAVIERKRANGGAACEPLALTRCKSEPMSTAAAKLMPEPGCWKDNVEPHRQASVGVGAAGVGF